MSVQTKNPARKSWRDVLQVHAAAELFPEMPSDELRALGEDISKNGQRQPIAIIEKARRRPDGTLHVSDPPLQEVLDGRSRLDATEAAGIRVIGKDGQLADQIQRIVIDTDETDPVAFVISANLHRRHLSAEDKRDLIAKLLKVDPSKSDRQIAETVKASPTTVGTVRAEIASTVQSGRLPEKRVGKDGKARKQPPSKPRKLTTKPQGTASKPSATTDDKPQPRDDIGPASTSEMAHKDAEIEELCNAKQQLKIKVAGLESEIEEVKAAAPPAERKSLAEKLEPLIETLFEQGLASAAAAAPPVVMAAVVKLERLLVEHGIMPKSRRYEDPQAYARALKARTTRQWEKEHLPKADSHATPPPSDDGLDIPECLRRSASS